MEFKDAVLRFIELSEDLKPKLILGQLEANSESESIFNTLYPNLCEDIRSSASPDEHFTKILVAELLDCLHYLMHHSQENLITLIGYLNEKKDSKKIGSLPTVKDALIQALRKASGISKADLEYKVYCDYIVSRAQGHAYSEEKISFMSRKEWKPYKKRGYPCFKEYYPDTSACWWRLDRKSLPIAVGGKYRKKCYDYLKMDQEIPEPRLGVNVLARLLLLWISEPELKAKYIFDSITFQRKELSSMIDQFRANALRSIHSYSSLEEKRKKDIFVAYVEGLKDIFQVFLSAYVSLKVQKSLQKLNPKFRFLKFLEDFLNFDAIGFAGFLFIKDLSCPVEGEQLDFYLVEFSDPYSEDICTDSDDENLKTTASQSNSK